MDSTTPGEFQPTYTSDDFRCNGLSLQSESYDTASIANEQPVQNLMASYGTSFYPPTSTQFVGLPSGNYPYHAMPRSCPDFKVETSPYTIVDEQPHSVYGYGTQSPSMPGIPSIPQPTSLPPDYYPSTALPIYTRPNTPLLYEAPTDNRPPFQGSPRFCSSQPHMRGDTPDDDTPDREQPYAKLIYKALMEAPNNGMVLKDIYKWFEENTDKASGSDSSKGWQNSIRHNLSMNGAFQKVDLSSGSGGDSTKKSFLWKLTEEAKREGVKSTTRYRTKQPHKRVGRHMPPAPQRQASGSKGGKAAKRAAQRRSDRLRQSAQPSSNPFPPFPSRDEPFDRSISPYFVDGAGEQDYSQQLQQDCFGSYSSSSYGASPSQQYFTPTSVGTSEFSSYPGTPVSYHDEGYQLQRPQTQHVAIDAYVSGHGHSQSVPLTQQELNDLILRHEADSSFDYTEYQLGNDHFLST